jgi:hypothetical protein
MKKHYFRVHWSTRTRFSTRHYCREYETEEEAIKKARELDAKPLTEGIGCYEGESWEDSEDVLHIRIIRQIKWWED